MSINISNLPKGVQEIAKGIDKDGSGTINTSDELGEFFTKCSQKNVDTGILKIKQQTGKAQQPAANLVQHTPHKCNRGWYPATADNNPIITGDNGILANHGNVIKNSQDPAGLITMAVLATKGSNKAAGSNLGKDQLRQMIIKANPGVFNPDGSLKPNADLGRLDLPKLDKMGTTINNTNPTRRNVPKGFYPAFTDGQSNISGLNERTLRQNDTNAAYQVFEVVLNGGKKVKSGRPDVKAMLLNDLVRKNPSVFKPDGTLKPNADLSKLDIPTIDYMNSHYKFDPGNAGAKYKFSPKGCYCITKDNVTKYYQANGTEINTNIAHNMAPDLFD